MSDYYLCYFQSKYLNLKKKPLSTMNSVNYKTALGPEGVPVFLPHPCKENSFTSQHCKPNITFSEKFLCTSHSSPTLVKTAHSKIYPLFCSSFTVFSRVSIIIWVSPLFRSSSCTNSLLLKTCISTCVH